MPSWLELGPAELVHSWSARWLSGLVWSELGLGSMLGLVELALSWSAWGASRLAWSELGLGSMLGLVELAPF